MTQHQCPQRKGLSKMFDFNTLIGGGVAGAIVTALGSIVYVLLNKRVKTPADDAKMTELAQAARRDDISERNQLLAEVRRDVTDLKVELGAAKVKIEQQDSEIDSLKQEALERDHYIYRCIHVIQRLGTAEDIPQPNPFAHK